MPSMRQSYTVTVPEEPPAAAFPFLKQEMRRKGSGVSGSVLVSTFVGLLINQAKNSKSAQGLVGLKNLGNTCFMNSILQCLSNTHSLRDYCLHNSHRRDLNNNSRTNTALMEEFAKLMQTMWTSSSSEAVSPSEFKTQIQRYAPRFVGYNQQDAQEFLRFLLDGLHNEVNRVTVRPRGTAEDFDHLPDEEKGKKMWNKYLEREDSKIVDLKRFSEARRTSKLSTFVNFPMKDLDLREFASEHSINAVYNLYAVSNHSGTTMGGHYTAYCRNPNTGEWHTFNDSSYTFLFLPPHSLRPARVTPLNSLQVRSSDAYVLFYELASSSRL
ncbi:hypothetical protein F2P81_017006 [Scophthalmus maximus]|uniref:Ubiquitin carboxyl-terminal hydrolase 2 n=1 Tax=Scophthalmus maximus TaxID=52904 RepID=A0A6A4SCT5_SCOMX|nr:hypothetical protein F2P81_017006 [Scophthalmus maximus]